MSWVDWIKAVVCGIACIVAIGSLVMFGWAMVVEFNNKSQSKKS